MDEDEKQTERRPQDQEEYDGSSTVDQPIE